MINKNDVEWVYQEYSYAVYCFVRSKGRDPESAQDVVSETFKRLIEQVHLGRGPRTNIKSYLFRTAAHLVVDAWRTERMFAPLLVLENEPDNEIRSPELHGEIQVYLGLVLAAMKSISEREAKAIILQYVNDCSQKQTRDALGISQNHVKVTRVRGMRRLRKALCHHIFEDRQI